MIPAKGSDFQHFFVVPNINILFLAIIHPRAIFSNLFMFL